MFKGLLLFLSIGFGSFAFAEGVKITSFRFLENNTSHFSPTAEICGELSILTGKPEMIKIVSDPDLKGPAHYYSWAGKNGKFCSVIATFTGKANVDLDLN